MELKEYLEIFKKHIVLFLAIIVLTVFGAFVFQKFYPLKYKAEVTLNITRNGYQKNTNDYRYDDFYRLQADERFADTVVRWINSGVTRFDIYRVLNEKNIRIEKLKAERLSSQMIRLTYLLSQANEANSATKTIDEILNEETSKLNKYQQDPNWFKVLTGHPVVRNAGFSFEKLFIFSLLLGFFIAFWAVLIRNYFVKKE